MTNVFFIQVCLVFILSISSLVIYFIDASRCKKMQNCENAKDEQLSERVFSTSLVSPSKNSPKLLKALQACLCWGKMLSKSN